MQSVQQIMTVNPLTVAPETPLAEVALLMQQHNFRHLPVVEDGQLVGIITDRDVRAQQRSFVFARTPARCAMTPNPLTVAPQTPLADACALLAAHKFDALPVTLDGRLVGILTVSDLVRAYGAALAAAALTNGG